MPDSTLMAMAKQCLPVVLMTSRQPKKASMGIYRNHESHLMLTVSLALAAEWRLQPMFLSLINFTQQVGL